MIDLAFEEADNDDPCSTRYVIRGYADEDELDVVCRFRQDAILLIINTIFLMD